MRASSSLVMVLVVAACGSKDTADKANAASPAKPMPVAFGDCAGPTVAWVSGPRPQPFTLEQAAGVWTAAAEPLPPAAQDDPPPPDDDESGGAGTAMALDEMAKRDSDRAEGQYKMKKPSDDPQLARQQALEAARSSGLLGSTNAVKGGAFAVLTGTSDTFDDTNIYGGLLGDEVGATGFGFGTSGTGWGTIGTGRYGTIGHGSAFGVGRSRGGMVGRRTSVPTTSIGQPNAQGDLDKAIIRRFIKRNIQKITYCYEKQLLAKPTLAGTIMVQFFIAPSGSVASAQATGVDPEVSRCVAGVIKTIEFPKPKSGGGVQVNYPFTFRSAGDEPAAPIPSGFGSGSGSASGASGSAAAPPPDRSPPRELFRSADHAVPNPSTYTPGANNPLRTEQAALTECFKRTTKPYGTVVVALSYDATGNVTTATAHGLDAEPAACVVAAVKRLKRTGAGSSVQRCSIAFGEQPITDLVTVDVTKDAILLGNDRLAAAAADDLKVPELVAVLERRHRLAVAPSGPVVVDHSPTVIRPSDDATLASLIRVLSSVLSTGDDFILAARRGTEWKLLRPMTFPTVPVPFGTGGTWNPVKGKPRAASGHGDRVKLSVLISEDNRITVGLSQGTETKELAHDAKQADNLVALLATHKASKPFADRVDLEIAGDDRVLYGDLVRVIDAAVQAGFVDWQLTTPTGLATVFRR